MEGISVRAIVSNPGSVIKIDSLSRLIIFNRYTPII